MENITLKATKREVIGKRVRDLRDNKQIPAVVYGHGVDTNSITLDYVTFEKALAKAGESTLIDLAVDAGEPVKVLIQEVQFHPLSGKITHADFRQVRMTEQLELDIEFEFIGEAPALRAGAILVKSMDKVAVRCLPKDLVSSITIDLSILMKVGDRIAIEDLTPPPGIEFMIDPNAVIVVANEPISEEELKSLDAKPEVDVTAIKSEADVKKEAAAKAAEAEPKK